jgi:hypothetical protein
MDKTIRSQEQFQVRFKYWQFSLLTYSLDQLVTTVNTKQVSYGVGVPVYILEQNIPKCLHSIIRQSLTALELHQTKLRNSTGHRISSEADSRSANQDIPSKFNYFDHKSQLNPAQIITHFLELHLNIIIPSTPMSSPMCVFSSGFPNKIYEFHTLARVLYAPYISF